MTTALHADSEGQLGLETVTLHDDGLAHLIGASLTVAAEMKGSNYPRLAKQKREIKAAIEGRLAVERDGEYTFIVNDQYLLQVQRSTTDAHEVEAKPRTYITMETI